MTKKQKPLDKSSQRVQKFLKIQGAKTQIIELPQEIRTAVEAANAIGCQLGQIAKSLIFKIKSNHQPLLVITSGANQVNERKIVDHVGSPIKIADADFVQQKTGFVIGGVPPIGHLQPIKTFIDQDLLRHQEIWAAAGHPKTVFKITPQELVRITQGRVIEVT